MTRNLISRCAVTGASESTSRHPGAPVGHDTDLVGLMKICILGGSSFNSGDRNLVYVSTPAMLWIGTARIQTIGINPELEVFASGQLRLINQIISEGRFDARALTGRVLAWVPCKCPSLLSRFCLVAMFVWALKTICI